MCAARHGRRDTAVAHWFGLGLHAVNGVLVRFYGRTRHVIRSIISAKLLTYFARASNDHGKESRHEILARVVRQPADLLHAAEHHEHVPGCQQAVAARVKIGLAVAAQHNDAEIIGLFDLTYGRAGQRRRG